MMKKLALAMLMMYRKVDFIDTKRAKLINVLPKRKSENAISNLITNIIPTLKSIENKKNNQSPRSYISVLGREMAIDRLIPSIVLMLLLTATQASVITIKPMVSISDTHACALSTDGTVSCWGYNDAGELTYDGNYIPTSRYPRVALGLTTTATAVAVQTGTSCASLTNGTVECWGLNTNRIDPTLPYRKNYSPVPVSGITTATTLVSSSYPYGEGVGLSQQTFCALLQNGTIQCFGAGSDGQLGNGTTPDISVTTNKLNQSVLTPVTVSGITTATALAFGQRHACALLSNGNIQCWGKNDEGQLGNGTIVSSSTPVVVIGVKNAIAISAGGDDTCAVLSDGTIKCWGRNDYGQLGNGGPPANNGSYNSSIPVLVNGISSALAVSTSGISTCAILAYPSVHDGVVQCWGKNDYGQLGYGPATKPPSYVTNSFISYNPVTVPGIYTATTIVTRKGQSCATLNDGKLQCWGDGFLGGAGFLDKGEFFYSPTPVSIFGVDGLGLLNLGIPKLVASPSADSDKTFDWAERTYPQLFAPASQPSQTASSYYFRYYAKTNSFLAVNDGHLFYLGSATNNTIADLGLLTVWLAQVK